MPTMQGVGPDKKNVPIRTDRKGRVMIVLGGPQLWALATLNAVTLGSIIYLLVRLG